MTMNTRVIGYYRKEQTLQRIELHSRKNSNLVKNLEMLDDGEQYITKV